ncbi:uncharacterized protein BcabD6B2_39240 [Babesia caballi]|uniref:Uncharacterized protein n=1 Tax=Babesia caballi TaxID=5871 RepID=A0AAV4LXI9_BABCB|nr:hypothetical protein BcabD6B2_39240 [Babesia caballi]
MVLTRHAPERGVRQNALLQNVHALVDAALQRGGGHLVEVVANALVGEVARVVLVVVDDEWLARSGEKVAVEPVEKHGLRRLRKAEALAFGRLDAPDFDAGLAGDEVAALGRGALLQNGEAKGRRAVAPAGLEHEAAAGSAVGLGQDVVVAGGRLEHDCVEQGALGVGSVLPGGYLEELRVAAEALDQDAHLAELEGELLGAGLGVGQVALGGGDDEGDVEVPAELDGLARLLHEPLHDVHDDEGDVGDGGAAAAHGVEDLVAGRVDQGHGAVAGEHVGAHRLGDVAGLAADVGAVREHVEESGLAVVDVPHEHDHGRPLEVADDVLGAELLELLPERVLVDVVELRALGHEVVDALGHVYREVRLGVDGRLGLEEQEPEDVLELAADAAGELADA